MAYDLQAGTYVADTRSHFESKQRSCRQLADLIAPVLPAAGSLLEVGVGEATTLAGVLKVLGKQAGTALGFDISWSRIAVANAWLQEQSQLAELVVGDLMHIPLADDSVDVVYSSHSLEPNGGQEVRAIAECLRVARHAVVLVEPLYELAHAEEQSRMRHHGYVRGLKDAAEQLGAEVLDHRLLEIRSNPLNPRGVLSLRKKPRLTPAQATPAEEKEVQWMCPLTGALLQRFSDLYFAEEVGIAYPIVQGVPLLRPEHAVVASQLFRR